MEKDQSQSILKNEIEVTLTTTLPAEFKISNNRISIPSNYDTEKLRKLVKKLLKINEDGKNFIFFINDLLIDNTINSFLTNNNFDLKKISETGLEIAYSFEANEPQLINTIKEDEWIRKIAIRLNQKYDVTEKNYYCVGLFNSEISFYNNNFEKVLKIEDSKKDESSCELLYDVLFFSRTDKLSDNTLIKSSRNDDYNFQIYQVDFEKMSSNLVFVGDRTDYEYVNTLALNPVNFNYFATGDSNGTIKIYNLEETSQSEIESNKKKKRKTEAQTIKTENIIDECHGTNEVKIIKWINNQQILSSGDDFIVKLWNIQTKSNYSVFNTNYKMTTAICPILPGNDKFLTGHEDGSIRLWDIRVNNSLTLSSNKIIFQDAHKNYISDICINPDSANFSHNFTSVGYDKLLKIWDIRSTKKALYEIQTDSEKNYSAVYNSREYLMTGGDNSTINVYQNKF
jgi:WD40 repeat protein